MWLVSGTHDDPEDDKLMDKDSADALYSAVKSMMYAIRTEVHDAQLEAAHRMIHNAKPRMFRRPSESKLGNDEALVRILKDNPHHVDLE